MNKNQVRKADKVEWSEFETANQIFHFIASPVSNFCVWGTYLISTQLDDKAGLRRNIFLIWVMSLRDTIDGSQRYIEKIKYHVDYYQNKSLEEGYDLICNLIKFTKDFFSLYTKSDQVFLGYMRDNRVHSWLHNYNEGIPQIKWIEDGVLKSEKILWSELEEIIRPYVKENYSNCVTELYKRSLGTSLINFLNEWSDIKKLNSFRQELFKGLEWNKKDPVQSVWGG